MVRHGTGSRAVGAVRVSPRDARSAHRRLFPIPAAEQDVVRGVRVGTGVAARPGSGGPIMRPIHCVAAGLCAALSVASSTSRADGPVLVEEGAPVSVYVGPNRAMLGSG